MSTSSPIRKTPSALVQQHGGLRCTWTKDDRTLRLEDIEIPDPGPRTISKAERLLARIMAPNDGPSRIHGLHGKKLM